MYTPPYVILLIRTFLTLEGIAGQVDLPPRLEHTTDGAAPSSLSSSPPPAPPSQVDPSFNIYEVALPWAVQRALAVDRGGHRRPPLVGVGRRRKVPVGARRRADRGAKEQQQQERAEAAAAAAKAEGAAAGDAAEAEADAGEMSGARAADGSRGEQGRTRSGDRGGGRRGAGGAGGDAARLVRRRAGSPLAVLRRIGRDLDSLVPARCWRRRRRGRSPWRS